MKPPVAAHGTLSARFARQFEPWARAKGLKYADSGRVRILEGDEDFVSASVHGSEDYDVEIALDAECVAAFCTCPRFDDGFLCKHLWATLVAAERAGHLTDLKDAPEEWVLDSDDGPEPDDEVGDPEEDGGDDKGRILELPPPARRPAAPAEPPAPGPLPWRRAFDALESAAAARSSAPPLPDNRQLLYELNADDVSRTGTLRLQVYERRRNKDGTWSPPMPASVAAHDPGKWPEADRALLQLIVGAGMGPYGYFTSRLSEFRLSPSQLTVLLPDLCRTGRLQLFRGGEGPDTTPWTWDDGEPWQARLRLDVEGDVGIVRAWLARGEERMDLAESVLTMASGILFARGRASRFRFDGDFAWIVLLRKHGTFRVPLAEAGAFLESLHRLAGAPALELPEDLRPREVRMAPRPRLRVVPAKAPQFYRMPEGRLHASLAFAYGDVVVASADPLARVFDGGSRTLIVRDPAAEEDARRALRDIGLRPVPAFRALPGADVEFPAKRLPAVVADLVGRGWHVEAPDAVFRAHGAVRVSVTSGIDWFDVGGGVDFGGEVVPFPRLLRALRAGERYVRLGDGTYGVLPEAWLRRNRLALGAGEAEGDQLRFRPGQAFLLDALLSAEPAATFDEGFRRVRDRLQGFERVQPRDPPAGFQGALRPYQRAGLGWLHFLRAFGLGGCLADDMGLGKTVQLLAYLESRREAKAGPSLAVVPRSLVFNWKAEAARFTPSLRILDHSGPDRPKDGAVFAGADVVLTTYGILRRDAALLKDVRFDCVVLDEAQAIKNASSATAKAARLLKGEQRLALSGTPIENHLGELWSLMECLNPGLLGGAAVFRGAVGAVTAPDGDARSLLARALRPFILRRTKQQVAPELPPRIEQTLQVELEPDERRRYDELREHYRQRLLGGGAGRDWNKTRFVALEALLRLRQAACHPGLLDPALRGTESSKLDTLLAQLREVVAEGHKALVFSQFTTFLGIVRAALDREKVAYAYLDGQTRNRAEVVARFQSDAGPLLFLISLKAGGLGLNLTAAEYVFLLDPWWNPAVEAQAIDRTHRIGQGRTVLAYRLVARDTVEEKVIQLQQSKRALAEAILLEDRSLLAGLTREDLALLLS